MSTDFISKKPISFDELRFFAQGGIYVDSAPDDDSVILTDGKNYLWAVETSEVKFGAVDEIGEFIETDDEKSGVLFTRYAGNRPEKIITAIEAYFETELISEHSDLFKAYLSETD